MAKIIVMHSNYGCDTGCCGHVVQVENEFREFVWDHPSNNTEKKEFAERLVIKMFGEEHVKDLDWDNSVILSDNYC